MRWKLYSHSYCETSDSEQFVQYATTIMGDAARKYGDSIFPDEAPRIISINDLSINKPPSQPIIKMIKSQYVREFFDQGKLQLGSFEYFAQHENSEVRDEDESILVIVGVGDGITTVSKIGSGYNYRVFSCYTGGISEEIMNKFGYDAAYEIVDPVGFFTAIAGALESLSSCFGQCAYTDRKVVSCRLSAPFQAGMVGNNITFPENDFRYFLKSAKFCHQKETRFIWRTAQDVDDAVVICCPEATRYCRELS